MCLSFLLSRSGTHILIMSDTLDFNALFDTRCSIIICYRWACGSAVKLLLSSLSSSIRTQYCSTSSYTSDIAGLNTWPPTVTWKTKPGETLVLVFVLAQPCLLQEFECRRKSEDGRTIFIVICFSDKKWKEVSFLKISAGWTGQQRLAYWEETAECV